MTKVALVTGGAQGIGEGISLKLASDGFDIAIADLAFQQEKAEGVIRKLEELGRKAIFIPTDVSVRDDIFKAVSQTAEQLGGFDVIVNNAGIAQVKPLLDVQEADLEKIFRINVYSVIWGIQAAAAKFEELNNKGHIISAASIAAVKGFPILGVYSSTKFAVRGLTQVAAQELAPKGITVNAYAPGIVLTPMWDQIDAELSKLNGKPLGENLKETIESIALGRGETPEDVAGVVSFLASDNANYVTGQTILVDGGILYN